MLVKLFVLFVLFVHLTEQSNLTFPRSSRVKRNSDVCGKPAENVASLIYGGESFGKGAWPWMVALLKQAAPKPVFFCAGTLISETMVVTAAHCLHQKHTSSPTKVQEIFMMFGAYDLKLLHQSGAYSASPIRIHLHPDWNPHVRNFDADIAMLETEDDVPFTRLIKPICLWQQLNEPDINEGIIAGWGISEKDAGFENLPKQLKIPIISKDECRRQTPKLIEIGSPRTFCGGSRDGTGPCLGDSGTGLFIEYQGKFHLRGIVSASLLNNEGRCDVFKYALYTNILKFTPWIEEVSQSYRTSPTSTYDRPVSVTLSTQTPLPAFVPRTRPLEIQLELPFSQELEKPTQSSTNDICGVMAGTDALIKGGYFNPKEVFPWSVAVLRDMQSKKATNYITGTLVSQRHVLVPASFACEISSSNQLDCFPVNTFTMYFGVIDINFLSDINVSSSKVRRISLHPSFKAGSSQRANIALLEKVDGYDKNMVPICLWPLNGSNFIRTHGYAVGWGYDESETPTSLRKYHQAKSGDCGNQFAEYLSTASIGKYFCLKSLSNDVPCVNDNPFYAESGGKWYLLGIWSTKSACVRFQSSLYEDITLMTSWIQNEIRQV